MRILIIPDRLEVRGGLETHVVTLAKEWAKKTDGNEVMIYANAISREYQNKLSSCSLVSGWNNDKENYILKNFKPDIIIAHPFSGIEIGYNMVSKLEGCKLFVTMHGNYVTGLQKEYLDKITKVICVSETAYNAVKTIVPIEKLEVIYNGINTKDFFPTKPSNALMSKMGILKKYKTISIITRLDDGKQQPVKQLLEIIPDLANRVRGLNCVIVGGGTYLDEIKDTCSKFRKSPNLKLKVVGEVDVIRSYINIADIVLGCDRVALEAILCKKNVFYMGQFKWKGLVKTENYKELLFSNEGYVSYTNEELLNHMVWMLERKKEIEPYTDDLFANINDLCSLTNIANRYIDIFNNNKHSKKKELN
jgi:glycosyltransferase involved in cell wall biosynthesis